MDLKAPSLRVSGVRSLRVRVVERPVQLLVVGFKFGGGWAWTELQLASLEKKGGRKSLPALRHPGAPEVQEGARADGCSGAAKPRAAEQGPRSGAGPRGPPRWGALPAPS